MDQWIQPERVDAVASVPPRCATIKPMHRSDVPAVMRVDKRCFPMPWAQSAYNTELNNRTASYFVARLGQELVGYGGEWVIMEEAHITTLAVDPEFRRQGIGERLLVSILEEAVSLRASRATLEVREGNRGAQCLYRRYGFRPVALRRRYYTDNGDNAIVMWAESIQTQHYRWFLRDRSYSLQAGRALAAVRSR